MKRIIDTFTLVGSHKTYSIQIDVTVPTPKDVRAKLSHVDAMHAIELMLVPEEIVRKHLRIGSTPPTRVAVENIPEEHKRLQTLVYEAFGETYICL